MGFRDRPRRRARRSAALAVAGLVASILPLVVAQPGHASPDRPGFKFVGSIPIEESTHTSHGAIELDSIHRRAYQYYLSQEGSGSQVVNFLEFKVWDLDRIEGGVFVELPRIRIDDDFAEAPCNESPNNFVPWLQCQGQTLAENSTAPLTVDNSRRSVTQLDLEPVTAVDEAGGRLFYSAAGAIYEIRDYDAADGSYALTKWVAPPNPGGIPESMNLPSGTQNLLAKGLVYDPDARLDASAGSPRPTLYTVGSIKTPNAPDSDVNTNGVYLAGWDARPSEDGAVQPELRQQWVYVTRACRNLNRSPSTATEQVVVRMGEWLLTYCDGSADKAGRGVVRVRLAPGASGALEPVPESEQFFPGVSGSDIETAADPAYHRLYVSTNNAASGTRSALVFDATVGGGRGGYVGEIAFSKRKSSEALREGEIEDGNVAMGLDPTTGRWYMQTKDGLAYQDGRIVTPNDAVSQINVFPHDVDDRRLFGQATKRSIRVDDAVLAPDGSVVRRARLFVARGTEDSRRYDAYEDTSPYPGTPPPQTENTLNVPEGPGLAGTYSAVTSAYGVRLRVVRGASTVWPSGVAPLNLSFENPSDAADESGSPQPSTPFDYAQDPFFFYAGECGAADRELTFGRVLGATLSGDQFNQDAKAGALAVDPDVHRPSSADDTQTRDDLAHPDPVPTQNVNRDTPDWQRREGCARDLFEAMTRQDSDPADGNFDDLGQDWPYATTRCEDDEDPDDVSTNSPIPGRADVACGASADAPNVGATTRSAFTPEGFPVAVRETRVSTDVVRTPGDGVEAVAEVVVRGLSVGGLVELDEMRVRAVARAEGYADADGSTARVEVHRTFMGLTVGGVEVCSQCPEPRVLEELNAAIGPYGYVKVPDPEPDFTLGTSKGTLALVQKNLLEQAADATTNRDFSTEWPGLEIGVYRDGVERGRGRWIVQLGGVFTQTQFGVVTKLADLDTGRFDGGDDTSRSAPTSGGLGARVEGVVESAGPETFTIVLGGESVPASAVEAVEQALQGVLQKIREGLRRSLAAAALLASLWALVFSPVYVARRRSMLKHVARS